MILLFNYAFSPLCSRFARLTQHILIREKEKISKLHENERHMHFPNFLWLLRDYSLVPRDSNGAAIPIKEYVTTKLLP